MTTETENEGAKISLSEVADERGYGDVTEMLGECIHDSIIPACCSEGCDVEMDGTCEHGHPSIYLEAGLI